MTLVCPHSKVRLLTISGVIRMCCTYQERGCVIVCRVHIARKVHIM